MTNSLNGRVDVAAITGHKVRWV